MANARGHVVRELTRLADDIILTHNHYQSCERRLLADSARIGETTRQLRVAEVTHADLEAQKKFESENDTELSSLQRAVSLLSVKRQEVVRQTKTTRGDRDKLREDARAAYFSRLGAVCEAHTVASVLHESLAADAPGSADYDRPPPHALGSGVLGAVVWTADTAALLADCEALWRRASTQEESARDAADGVLMHHGIGVPPMQSPATATAGAPQLAGGSNTSGSVNPRAGGGGDGVPPPSASPPSSSAAHTAAAAAAGASATVSRSAGAIYATLGLHAAVLDAQKAAAAVEALQADAAALATRVADGRRACLIAAAEATGLLASLGRGGDAGDTSVAPADASGIGMHDDGEGDDHHHHDMPDDIDDHDTSSLSRRRQRSPPHTSRGSGAGHHDDPAARALEVAETALAAHSARGGVDSSLPVRRLAALASPYDVLAACVHSVQMNLALQAVLLRAVCPPPAPLLPRSVTEPGSLAEALAQHPGSGGGGGGVASCAGGSASGGLAAGDAASFPGGGVTVTGSGTGASLSRSAQTTTSTGSGGVQSFSPGGGAPLYASASGGRSSYGFVSGAPGTGPAGVASGGSTRTAPPPPPPLPTHVRHHSGGGGGVVLQPYASADTGSGGHLTPGVGGPSAASASGDLFFGPAEDTSPRGGRSGGGAPTGLALGAGSSGVASGGQLSYAAAVASGGGSSGGSGSRGVPASPGVGFGGGGTGGGPAIAAPASPPPHSRRGVPSTPTSPLAMGTGMGGGSHAAGGGGGGMGSGVLFGALPPSSYGGDAALHHHHHPHEHQLHHQHHHAVAAPGLVGDYFGRAAAAAPAPAAAAAHEYGASLASAGGMLLGAGGRGRFNYPGASASGGYMSSASSVSGVDTSNHSMGSGMFQ